MIGKVGIWSGTIQCTAGSGSMGWPGYLYCGYLGLNSASHICLILTRWATAIVYTFLVGLNWVVIKADGT
jgi:hypothetical protein